MANLTISRQRARKGMLASSIALLLVLLFSACGNDPQTQQMQQQARQNKTALDQVIAQARDIGVPNAALQPVLSQITALSRTNAPITIFSNQPATDYYTNLAQRYTMLTTQVRGLEAQSTQQSDYQATIDLQTLGNILAQRQAQGFNETKTFADQLAQDQSLMAQAQYPKNYIQISDNAKATIEALRLMGPAHDELTALQQVIKQLKASHLDTTALEQQEQYDLTLFRQASKPEDFTQITDQVNTQLQETVALSTQAIPYVGAAKIREFTGYIQQMSQYGMDVTAYKKSLDADQTSLDAAQTLSDFLKVSAQIDKDLASVQFPLLKGKTNYLLSQFHQEVASWGNSHIYHDAYNGGSYRLDYEYDQQGIGPDADYAVQTAQTQDDYMAAIDLINSDMQNLKAMEADYSDNTPYNQPHAADMHLMQSYGLTSGQVIVVSLIEQTLRLYQNGQLVKAFYITSGQYDKPSLPGYWHIFFRESPTVFKSSEPKGSAFWYPDTKINFAMEYHDGGYFFHDSWWRANYGPGTNFPHFDSSGDVQFSYNGSHGCINVQEDLAGWLYNNTGYGTAVIIY